MWEDGFSQAEWSRARGREKQVNLVGKPSCLDIIRLSVVIIMVVVILLPHCGTAWRGATVLVVTALLARRWFANCPARRGLALAFSASPVLSVASW